MGLILRLKEKGYFSDIYKMFDDESETSIDKFVINRDDIRVKIKENENVNDDNNKLSVTLLK